MNPLEWLLLVVLSVLWGSSFLFNGIAVRSLPTFSIVAARIAIAAVVLHLVLAARGVTFPRDRRVWASFLIMGILNNVIPLSLVVWGQARIAAGLAAILIATTPVFTVIVAHLATGDERVTPRKVGGVLVGFAGVATIVGPGALAGLSSGLVAQLAILAAAASYACAAVFGRRFARQSVAPLVTATGQMTFASLILIPLALIIDQPWTVGPPSAQAVWALLGLGLLSSALAYVIYFRILATAGATNVLLVTFLVPVTANALGWLVLDERLDPHHAAGVALIAVGLAAIDGRLFARDAR